MSIRSNIKVTDAYGDTLWFYRHSDGYPHGPHGAVAFLRVFMQRVANGEYRDNSNQSSGHLVVMGSTDEYVKGWKASLIEPTSGMHSDIEWLYTCNLEKRQLHVAMVCGDEVKQVCVIRFKHRKRAKVWHIGKPMFSFRDARKKK